MVVRCAIIPGHFYVLLQIIEGSGGERFLF